MTNNPGVEFRIVDCTSEKIYRCIACDICPIRPGGPDEYRCIIESKGDLFFEKHRQLTEFDAILVGAYSPIDRAEVASVYQRFTERTRYWRRDEYLIGDRLIAPFVISEINSNQNLHIRILTSFLRHHTVLHHPLIGMEFGGDVINWPNLVEQGKSFARNAIHLTIGRLMMAVDEVGVHRYNPVGYVISHEKRIEDSASGQTQQAEERRQISSAETKKQRIA